MFPKSFQLSGNNDRRKRTIPQGEMKRKRKNKQIEKYVFYLLVFIPNRSLEIFESKVLQNVSHNHLKHQQLTNDLQIYCIFSDKMKEDFSNDRFGFISLLICSVCIYAYLLSYNLSRGLPNTCRQRRTFYFVMPKSACCCSTSRKRRDFSSSVRDC